MKLDKQLKYGISPEKGGFCDKIMTDSQSESNSKSKGPVKKYQNVKLAASSTGS